MSAPHVVVVGGGLAGITAAMALRDAGIDVTLLEARPRLGGAATSFRRGELTIDNGQHVFLRCCDHYQRLLGRLGATGSVTIQDRFDVTVLTPDGRQARLRRSGLPGPLHLTRALAGYRLLTPGQRLRVARAALGMRLLDPAAPGLDQVRLGDWLAARGQDERTRRVLWDLFIVSALNVAGDDASLALAATVIKTALLGAASAADIGIASVPLGDLHGTAAAAMLGGLGARVRLGERVTGIERSADRWLVATGPEGAAAEYDGVLLAVPPGQASRLAVAAGAAGAARWRELGTSPIVNVHVRYDRRVTHLPLAVAVDSPVQWVFDKTAQAGVASGQYLAVSLSAADDYVDTPVARLREIFVPELKRLFPAAAGAAITDFFVTRERHATLRQAPGTGSLRPGAATGVRGLAVAGAWTDTGWPDTMEGAVRSGFNGAQELAWQLGAGAVGPAAERRAGRRAAAVAADRAVAS